MHLFSQDVRLGGDRGAMSGLLEFNPLKSIAIPNVGRVEPKGLVLVIGPNSAGKTQFLRDIQGRVLGQARKLVVCDDVEINRPSSLAPLLKVLFAENHIRRRVDENNNVFIEPRIPHFGGKQSNWSLNEKQVTNFFNAPSQRGDHTDKFLEHFGRSFIASLFLDRRLTVTDTVDNFDYEKASPSNELQALYIDANAKRLLAAEAKTIFGRAIWLDNTRANRLCLRVGNGPDMPSAEDRLEPAKMRQYRLIEDEGDGLKSYIAICLTLLLGQRPVVLIDEQEMCIHPQQAYALDRFIGRHGVSPDRRRNKSKSSVCRG